jgi:hypothetical protein
MMGDWILILYLYWLKLLLTTFDVVDAYSIEGICLGVKLKLKLSLSYLKLYTLFIDCRVLNSLGLCVIH